MTRERVSQKLNCLKSLPQCPPLHDKTPTPIYKQFAGRLLHMPPKSNTSSAPTATAEFSQTLLPIFTHNLDRFPMAKVPTTSQVTFPFPLFSH
ncbi:hypothetical protein ACSQ67_007512 [Phaseolus vulgaris]